MNNHVTGKINLPELNGFRGIAMLMVVGYHFGGIIPFGWAGMELFFVLSGFLISKILLDRALTGISLLEYFRNRMLRILPAYYVLLFLFFIVPLFFPDRIMPISYQEVAGIQGYFWAGNADIYFSKYGWSANIYLIHLWSVGVELKFYLLWPLFVWLHQRVNKFYISVLLLGSLIVLAIAWRNYGGASWQLNSLHKYTFFLSRLDAFAIGSLVFLIYQNGVFSKKLLGIQWVVGAIILFFLLTFLTGYWNGTFGDPFIRNFTGTLLSFGAGGLLLLFIQHSWYCRVGRNEVLQQLGKYSYGIYLFHNPIWLSVNKLPLPFWLNLAVSALLSLVAGYISYHLIERRFLRLKLG